MSENLPSAFSGAAREIYLTLIDGHIVLRLSRCIVVLIDMDNEVLDFFASVRRTWRSALVAAVKFKRSFHM